MSEGMVLLVLAAVVVVLLVVHRSEGDLGRAVVEYALVAVLAVLLAATPATAGMTAGVAAGVSTGSQKGAEVVGWAWRSTFGRPATAAPPATTRPARNQGNRPKVATQRPKDRPPAASQPETATGSPAAPGAPGRAVLLAVLGGLVLLVLGARRLRRHDLRRADELAMPLLTGLPFGRGRRRRAA